MADRSWLGAMGLAVGLVFLAANAASALEIHIGGNDIETQYTGFAIIPPDVDPPSDAGVLTFDNEYNGWNAPEPGFVDTSDLAALIGATVHFEVELDTSSFDPATGDVRNAQFIGTGDMPEITMTSNSTVLLSFQVDLLRVQQALHSGSRGGRPDGKIVLGNPLPGGYGVSSKLTVAGGTLNALVGGPGTHAVMEMLMSGLYPEMNLNLRDSGYLNSGFTNGVGTSAESTTWNITIIPEPSTAVLLGFSLLGVLAAARRRAPR